MWLLPNALPQKFRSVVVQYGLMLPEYMYAEPRRG